jgi:hypothetical protein
MGFMFNCIVYNAQPECSHTSLQTGLNWLKKNPLTGSCEDDYKSLVSLRGAEFPDQLSGYQFLMKEILSWHSKP